MHHHSTPFISLKHEHRLLGLMLITLHIALWWDFSSLPFSKIGLQLILLIHLSAFILWQPLWDKVDIEPFKNKMLLGLGSFIFIVFFNIGLISLWQIILLGLMGGRDLIKSRDRIVNMAAILFLSLDLFFITLPQLFAIEELILLYQFVPETRLFLNYGLLVIPLIFLFIVTDERGEHRYYIDFFHGLTVSMLMIIMGLSSLILISQSNMSLPFALLQLSIAITLFILVITALWVVFAEAETIEQLWTRHLLKIGNGFEQWLTDLAQPNHYRSLSPQEFLQAGFEKLLTLSWISGIVWHSLYAAENELGHKARQQVSLTMQSLEVTIYAHDHINASYYFQIKTLIQLLEHFHQAKRREAAFAQQAHLQAIHETGAKLTHDIKNLLQSLHAITSVIENSPPNKFGKTQRLLQAQMPHLTQRLKRTLDKLQKPVEFSYSYMPVSLWWSNLKARYRKSHIEFSSSTEIEDILIPEDLFDNISENLLQNALTKRKREPELHITVSLEINKRHLQLRVCDDGSSIPQDIAEPLLTQPVPSQEGFGIGLYQAVKQLANTGYELKVIENREGQVCFELASTE